MFTCFKDTVAHILVTGASVFGLLLRLSCTIFTGTRLLGCFWTESSNWCFTTCVTCEVCTLTGWNWDRSGSNCFSWFNNTEVTFGTTNVDSYVLTTSIFFKRLSENLYRYTVSHVYGLPTILSRFKCASPSPQKNLFGPVYANNYSLSIL